MSYPASIIDDKIVSMDVDSILQPDSDVRMQSSSLIQASSGSQVVSSSITQTLPSTSNNNVISDALSEPLTSATNIPSVLNAPFLGGSSSTLAANSTSSLNMNQLSKQIVDTTEHVVTRTKLLDLVKSIDPSEQLDEDVEELLLQYADNFVNSTIDASCAFAKHRGATTLEVKDVELYLDKIWNMWIPGFGTEEIRSYKKTPITEAHKQRVALIKKNLKKY